MRCCHCCSSSSTSGAGCPRRTPAVPRPSVLLGAAVSPLLWGVRLQQPLAAVAAHQQRRPNDDGHYMLDITTPLSLAPAADDSSPPPPPSTAGGWPTTAAAAAQWRPSFFQCCYSYASGVLGHRPPPTIASTSNRCRQTKDVVARIGARTSSSDDV